VSVQVAEIFAGTISEKQEAVDWLTYTFFYRRLPQNPNYYNMMGRSHRHIRDHLSELVEDVCQELHDAQAILVDETGLHLSIENLGIITAYHNISFKTAHRCNEALSAKVKTKSLLTVLCHATEFESLPIRPGEEHIIMRLLKHAKYEVPSLAVDVQTKANALLQAHIGRTPLRGDLLCDQRHVCSR
jgi:pre-mRNA-splicing helicase BRR2